MLVIYTPEGILCLTAVIFCMLACLILLIYSKKGNVAPLLLAASYFCLGYGFFTMFLIYSRLIMHVPHAYRTGGLSFMLQIPLSYLYVRTVTRHTPLKRTDYIHLVLPLLYIIDQGPIIFTSTAHKLSVIHNDLRDLKLVISFRQGWLIPPNIHLQARMVVAAIYWLFQLNLMKDIYKRTGNGEGPVITWLYIYNWVQTFLFFPALTSMLLSRSFVWATSIPPAAASLLSVIVLFMYPNVLYGIKKISRLTTVKPGQHLNDDLITQKKQLLEKLILHDKVFLNSNYTLKDLGADLELTPHQASALINQLTNTNFNNYLNQQRIHFCIELIKSEKISNLNLFGLAIKCGFNNRNTFTTAFKKFTGETPSGYLKLNKKSIEHTEK